MDQSFARFRPFCAALAAKPNLQVLQHLNLLVQETKDIEELERLQEYLVFPVQVYLKTPVLPENFTIEVLNFIAKFYDRVPLTSSFIMRDLLNSILKLTTPMGEQTLSEDLKISSSICLKSIVHACDASTKQVLLSEEMKLQISHIIFQSLDWAEKNPIAQLQTACLNLIFEFTVGVPARQKSFVDLFAPMLPGVSSKIMKILGDLALQSTPVKVLCLKTWRTFVSKIMCDFGDDLPTFHLNPQWLGKAQDHISVQLRSLVPLSTHEKLAVRTEMMNTCNDILSDCWNNLSNCVLINLDILAALVVDADLSEKSLELLMILLGRIRDEKGSDELTKISEVVQEKIHELASKLQAKRTAGLLNENVELVRILSQLNGYLVILKQIEDESIFFFSEQHLGHLLDGLLNIATLDKSRIYFATNQDLSDCEFLFNPQYYLRASKPEKNFRFLTTTDMRSRFSGIASLLADCGNAYILVSTLVDRLKETRSREAVLLLNEIVSGTAKDNMGMVEHVTEAFLNVELLTNEIVKADEESRLDWSFQSLVIEGFGHLATLAQGSADFNENYLPHILVYALANTDVAGDSHAAHVLFFSLQEIAGATGSPGIPELLRTNATFLCRDLNLRLRFLTKSKKRDIGLSTLLRVVLKILNVGDYPVEDVEDTMENLLTQLDLSWINPDQSITTDILKVIKIFVSSFNDEQPKQEVEDVEREWIKRNNEEGAITQLVIDLKRGDEADMAIMENLELEECPRDGFHEEKEEEEGVSYGGDDDEEELPSDRIKFLRETIDHTRHYVSMVARPQWQLPALEIIADCVVMMRMNEKELLPLVHQCWQSLKLLFGSPNIFIVDKAFVVLRVFARCAKDFIQRRTLTDVFPGLIKYLRRLQSIIQSRERQQTLLARQAKALLRRMVEGLWEFMALLSLNELEVDSIIKEMIEFVRFSNELQVYEEKSSFVPLRLIDDDTLWLKTRFLPVAHDLI